MMRIGILGAGAWGTALAQTARRAGLAVVIWAFEPEVAAAINGDRLNPKFLPDVALDPAITATNRVAEATDADAVLLALPAQHLRDVVAQAAPGWRPGIAAVICTKGVEKGTGALMSEVVASVLPAAPIAVLSGPSFATEVARNLPTAVTFASTDPGLREQVPARLGTPHFRIYSSDDVIGAELGGAIKNVLAIACGVIAGRGLGDNARAALITRGLAEMARLAVAKGAKPETLMGLSGLGDLVLTCTAGQSRNFSVGVALGRGRCVGDAASGRITVAEGVHSAAAVVALAARFGIAMPICAAVDAVLNGGVDIDSTIAALLSRPIKAEAWAA